MSTGLSQPILGESQAVKDLLKMAQRLSSAKTNVLIIGESGTGKELVARIIHDLGPLKNEPFVAVNCGAIPENLIESEFFGHKKGSFTGAVSEKMGLFEAAHGGTLFLDEVGELPFVLQVKLLRAIQEKKIRRVGGIEDLSVDVRIIAATNRNLEAAVKQGSFREDLYYRLNVILIRTPPLRDRQGDIEILAQAFLKKFTEKSKKQIESFEPEALQAIQSYHWPGNIRELENCIDRVVTLEGAKEVSLLSLPQAVQAAFKEKTQGNLPAQAIEIPAPDFTAGKVHLDEILLGIEKIYMNAALQQAGGIRKKAAELLGMNLRSFRQRLEKLGLKDEDP